MISYQRAIFHNTLYHTWYSHSLMTSAFWHQNILRHFTQSAPPLLYSWSDSPIRCSAPLYSRSGSLIRSAYYFLYISFCFRFNKSLTNLTSFCQHHLQYTWTTAHSSWYPQQAWARLIFWLWLTKKWLRMNGKYHSRLFFTDITHSHLPFIHFW